MNPFNRSQSNGRFQFTRGRLLALVAVLLLASLAWYMSVPRMRMRDMSLEERSGLDSFRLHHMEDFSIDRVLDMCRLIREEPVADRVVKMYESESLPEHLPEGASITSIEHTGNVLYIYYRMPEDREITLTLHNTGYEDVSLYDGRTDRFYACDSRQAVVYDNFRTGK